MLKDLERDARSGHGLDEAGAHALMLTLLAGGLPAERTGAILAHFRERGPSVAETTGFVRALAMHSGRLVAPPDRPRPVVLPVYRATRRQAGMTALVALMLKRYGVCVLTHGGPGAADDMRVTTPEVLLELGIEPATSVADAQARLSRDDFTFVPVDVLAPGLARLLRDGDPAVGGLATLLAQLVDPFGGDGYRVVHAPIPDDVPAIRDYLVATRADALLVASAGGAPFPDALDAPRLESFTAGVPGVGAEDAPETPALPQEAMSASATAAWALEVLSGQRPMPAQVLVELGACLAGVRRG